MSVAVPAGVAVFSRNHRVYLDEAAAIAKRAPSQEIVFRSRDEWATAGRAVASAGAIPIYFSPVGAEGQVEYVAELCGVLRSPADEDAETQEWLSRVLPSTRSEGLWEEIFDRPAATLYAIRACRKLERPFPMTRLVKVRDKRPISPDYRYSYSVVFPVRDAT